MLSNDLLFFLVVCLTTITFPSCTDCQGISSFTAVQKYNNVVLLEWKFKRPCTDTYVIKYLNPFNQKYKYINGNVSDGSYHLTVVPCNEYNFVFVQYHKTSFWNQERKQVTSKTVTITSPIIDPVAPEKLTAEFYNENTVLASWWYPEERVCFKSFIVQLFRIPKKECKNCEEIIFNEEATNNHIYITLNNTLCNTYRIVVWASNGVNSINRKFEKFDFSNQKDDDKQLDWHDTKFNLRQKRVYFIADFHWTLPPNWIVSICFPHFQIQLCNAIECKSFPSYIGNKYARITDLIPNTSYTVKFNMIRKETTEQLGSLFMNTEEIPSVQNLFVEVRGPETVILMWDIPNKIARQKEWFTLVLQEGNDLFPPQEIDSHRSNIVLENLKPCHDYNFSMEIKYNGFRSKANTVLLSTPVPRDEIHPVKDFHQSNVSSTSVELSWIVWSNFCNLDFQILYTDSDITRSYTANSSKLEIGNLTSCMKYTFYIYSINKKGVRKQEDLVQIVTMFGDNQPVLNLTTLFKSPYGFNITWEPPQVTHCISNYLVYLYDGDMNLTLGKYERPTNMRSVDLNNLFPCSTYKVKVISMWYLEEGNSSEIYIDTLSTVPEKVHSLAAFDIGDEIQLLWQHPKKLQNCVEKYEIQVEQTFPQTKIVNKKEIPGSQNIFNFSNLLHTCTNYTFYIRSVTSDNKSSEFVSTFFKQRPDELHVTVGQVIAVSAYSVKIKWEVKGGVCPVANFESVCKGPEILITYPYLNDMSLRTFVQKFDNLQPERSYICWGIAYNQHGETSYSNKTTVQTTSLNPSEPTNFTVLNKTTNSVYIVWSPPKIVPQPITEYLIKTENASLNYYIPSSCNKTYIADRTYSVPGNVTGYLIKGLQPYTKFDVSVKAVNGKIFGLSSPILTVTTLPDVPEQVRNLRVHLSLNETIVTWLTPCRTHGVLSHFLASMSATRLNNLNYPVLPQQNWTIAVKKNEINYTEVLKNLLPEYDYEMAITAVVLNVTQENPKLERFQCPAGIPPESLMTSDITLTILSSTKVAVSFNNNLFNDSQGEIRYYALLLSVSNFSQPEQSGWLGNNSSWPKENTWAVARLNSGVLSYQTTPLYWNPFTETAEAQYILGEEYCVLQLNASFCNGPLLEKTQYSLRIRGFTSSGYRDTVSMTFTTEIEVSYFQKVLVSFGFVGIISTVLVVFLVVSGRFVKELLIKEPQKKILVEPHVVGPPPMSPKKFLVHCNTVLDNEGRMKEEHDLLIGQSAKLASPMTIALLPHNTKKNRYGNVLPYDSNRVILEGDAESDYINASYIKFPGEKFITDYIACQAPKKDYCKDFWKMICQCNVGLIIMLCQFIEDNSNKCAKYFPEKGEVLIFDDITIFCKVQTEFTHHILRVFVINQNGIQRTVNHCHCVDWPDFGIPSSTEVMLKFCHYINNLNKTKQLTLVHCSAGIGRTGTYIALAVLLKQLKHNKKLSVFATVMVMRGQRANMVQTREQYQYIYRCIKFAIENQRNKIKKYLKEEKTIASEQIVLTENPVPSEHSSTKQVML